MQYIRSYNKFSEQRMFEKFIDPTGTVDKAVLDYWNGLYDKWVNGTLTPQEKGDYEKATAAKLYYIYEDKNSDVYKKLMEWEKLVVKMAQDREKVPAGLKISSDSKLQTLPKLERVDSELKAAGGVYNAQKNSLGTYKPTIEAFHKFLNTVEVPWQEICSELGIKTVETPKTKESWAKALKNWFIKLGDSISDRLEKFNDWLFPEKVEAEFSKEREKQFSKYYKERDSRVIRQLVQGLENFGSDAVKKYIKRDRNKIIRDCFFDFEGVVIERKNKSENIINGFNPTKEFTQNRVNLSDGTSDYSYKVLYNIFTAVKNKGENFYEVYRSSFKRLKNPDVPYLGKEFDTYIVNIEKVESVPKIPENMAFFNAIDYKPETFDKIQKMRNLDVEIKYNNPELTKNWDKIFDVKIAISSIYWSNEQSKFMSLGNSYDHFDCWEFLFYFYPQLFDYSKLPKVPIGERLS